jgi:serine/threonine-protein kinase
MMKRFLISIVMCSLLLSCSNNSAQTTNTPDDKKNIHNGLFLITSTDKDGKTLYGFIDNTGKTVIKPQFDSATNFDNGVSIAETNNKTILIDINGNTIANCPYRLPNLFSEGFLIIKDNDTYKYGFIDASGKKIVDCIYDDAEQFHEGLAKVSKGQKIGYINTKGELQIPLQFDSAQDFHEGMALVTKDQSSGFIDKNGNLLFNFTADRINNFSEGLAMFEKNNKYGYINTKGEVVIKPQFVFAYDFHDGLAAVTLTSYPGECNNDYGYINQKGEMVIKPQYVIPGDFNKGLAIVGIKKIINGMSYRKCGYINTKGKYTVKPNFDDAKQFSEGLAAVKNDNSWGFIDGSGKIIIKFNQYNSASDFIDGLAQVGVYDSSRNIYITKSGKVVWPQEE